MLKKDTRNYTEKARRSKNNSKKRNLDYQKLVYKDWMNGVLWA